jgi:hypothetical protein
MAAKTEVTMNQILRLARPQTGLDIYLGNLQQRATIGSPTFEEAKMDFHAAEVGARAYLDLV